MQAVDVGQLVDDGRWNGYSTRLIFGTALAILLVGVDNQLLGNAIPSMMKDWAVSRSAFASVQFVGPIGLLFGSLFGGILGDRIGRRSTLMLSVVVFAVMTLAISTIGSISMLVLLRFLSALGFGAAMPNAAVLAYEYVPKRNRVLAVTLTAICIPLGGFIAAYLAGKVLPVYGWRMLFMMGGVIPIVLAFILSQELPESPRYLASQPQRWPELTMLLKKRGHILPADIAFAESRPAVTGMIKASTYSIFAAPFRLDTLGLFGAFFFCLLANYIGIQWLVSMLAKEGFMPPFPGNVLGNWNLGGIVGALLGAFLIQRFGSRITIPGMSAASIVCAIILTSMKLETHIDRTLGLMTVLVLLGGFMNAVHTALYVLAANVYPTAIRATGVGTALAIGRIGNLMAGYVGPYAIDKGTPEYFSSFAIVMTFTLASLALVRRHIKRVNVVPLGWTANNP